MKDRRQFFKEAGLIALTSWPTVATPEAPQNAKEKPARVKNDASGIVLENTDMRLVIGVTGNAESLIHKASGQECLVPQTHLPMFTLTQYRPYDNELQLSFPAKPTAFPAERVRREGDKLLVSFSLVGYEATIRLKITASYIGFTLERLEYKGYNGLRPKKQTPIDETVFFQIPVRNRTNFGEWLNVVWDDTVAVNVLATDPYAQIEAAACGDYRLLKAGTVDSVQTEGVGAALITVAPHQLLDRVAQVEEDYDLPRGVASRRCKEYKYSYYEVLKTTPSDIDRHIKMARMGGFRTMDVYYRAFAKTSGHFPWRPEFPNGMQDVQGLVRKISDAGIVPGIHIHYNKADKTDEYVSPRPDPRLNITNSFTLALPLDASTNTITVEENPRQCTLDAERRILKIQDELIVYERYTTSPPHQFVRCQRGALGSKRSSYSAGSRIGLLDVDTWPLFVRFTQDTNIQEEVAHRLAAIYQQAGFKFVYFDGAEDVPGPEYWHTVSRAQWVVYKELNPKPLFAEGACKSHFSWHILTRGNAFDVFRPEVFKEAIRTYPAAEAPHIAKDFTSLNFGWVGYWAPAKDTIGTQPDMIEYATSRAAAWDCPISLVGDLPNLEAHPRTPDNLEVIKRWEDTKEKSWLTEQQKHQLRNLEQEHTLLVNERGDFELVPYAPIDKVPGDGRSLRAFWFERGRMIYVVYWHTSGDGTLEVHLPGEKCRLMENLGKDLQVEKSKNQLRLPLGPKRYLQCSGISRQDVIRAFQQARVSS